MRELLPLIFSDRIYEGELTNDTTLYDITSKGKNIVWAWDKEYKIFNHMRGT